MRWCTLAEDLYSMHRMTDYGLEYPPLRCSHRLRVRSVLAVERNGGTRHGTSGVIKALVGVIVIIHGAILLTEYANRLGSASRPLMILYAGVMLSNEALLGTGMIDGPNNMRMEGSAITTGMGWDAGMVALAVLMLESGVFMSGGRQEGDGTTGM
jgi:hypothetical protein